MKHGCLVVCVIFTVNYSSSLGAVVSHEMVMGNVSFVSTVIIPREPGHASISEDSPVSTVRIVSVRSIHNE